MDTSENLAIKQKREALLSRLLLIFLLAMILANLGGNMYGPLMSLYIKDLGASVPQIGLFFTVSSIIPLALQILGGWVSDSVGRLRAIAFGSLAGTLAYVALILAPTWEWLLLGSAFFAVGSSLVGPSFDAFIAEHSGEENRARMFGITQAIFMVVGVAGPVLGGWLARERGFKFMLLVAGFLYTLATIIRVGMAREAAGGQSASTRQALTIASLKANLRAMFGLLLSGGVLTWILITDGVRDTSFALSMNLLSVFMQEFGKLDLTQIGVTNSVFGLFVMLTTIPAGWLADKAGERVTIALGFLLIGFSIGGLVMLPPASV